MQTKLCRQGVSDFPIAIAAIDSLIDYKYTGSSGADNNKRKQTGKKDNGSSKDGRKDMKNK